MTSRAFTHAPRGVHAMLSADGRVWDQSKEIALADDAPNTDCGYPSSVEVGACFRTANIWIAEQSQ